MPKKKNYSSLRKQKHIVRKQNWRENHWRRENPWEDQ
jgi:hypothetical protein